MLRMHRDLAIEVNSAKSQLNQVYERLRTSDDAVRWKALDTWAEKIPGKLNSSLRELHQNLKLVNEQDQMVNRKGMNHSQRMDEVITNL